MANNWFKIDNADQIDTPALVIYYSRLKQNIKTAIGIIGDVSRLRPHVKTHKSAKVTQLLLESGMRKLKCATISEAEMLAQCGAPDVLLAYQPVGPKQIRLLKLIKTYPDTRFSCLVDHYSTAKDLSKLALDYNITVSVYVDINNGMDRTGVVPGEKAVKLYEQMIQLPGINPVGLHIYDGQIENSNLEGRRRACNASFEDIESMADVLARNDIHPRIVAGGAPTFPIHAQRPSVECSPGTFVFWDKGYQELCPEQGFLPAALVLTRVISLPTEEVVCLDLGYKSIAAENPPNHRVYFLNGTELQVNSQHEEHLVMNAGRNHSLKLGDLLYAIPIHICPTVARYNQAHVVKNNKVQEKWPVTARGRIINL
jgi:D-serine deaminase-like pyridoxal phosphate-dependent protein